MQIKMGGSDAAYAPEPVISARDDRLASLQVNVHDRVFGTHTVAHHTDERWVLLYIERWLKAPMTMTDGTTAPREMGTPQGSPISPLLANLFMHYAFDRWMDREHPAVRSSVTRMMWSSTATPSNRPNNSGPTSSSGSGLWALSCIPTRRRSCTAKTRTAVMRRSTPASTFSATPSGVAWPVADEASS